MLSAVSHPPSISCIYTESYYNGHFYLNRIQL